MRRNILILAAGVAAVSTGAIAANTEIHQKGRVFSEKTITVAAGETVIFVNDDSVPHNIVSTSPGNEFDLGSQKPGTATPVTFATPGEAMVICAIHPRMKLKVEVTE
jgi:plastocyanin